jgi:hypothetical protein
MRFQNLLSILGVEDRHIKPQDSGGVNIPCPFAPATHDTPFDEKKRFGIQTNGVYHCLRCHEKGHISFLLDRLAVVKGDEFDIQDKVSVIKDLLSSGGNKPKVEERRQITTSDSIKRLPYLVLNKRKEKPKVFVDYLDSRGVDLETSDKLGLSYIDEVDGVKLNGVKFPFFDKNNAFIGYAVRRIAPKGNEPKIHNEVDTGLVVYNLSPVDKTKPILLLEGLMGVARAVSQGAEEFFNVGALCGSSMSPQQLAQIVKEDLAVYLYLDNDSAGLNGTVNVATALKGKAPVLLPEHIGDIDDLTYSDFKTIREQALPCDYTNKRKPKWNYQNTSHNHAI